MRPEVFDGARQRGSPAHRGRDVVRRAVEFRVHFRRLGLRVRRRNVRTCEIANSEISVVERRRVNNSRRVRRADYARVKRVDRFRRVNTRNGVKRKSRGFLRGNMCF